MIRVAIDWDGTCRGFTQEFTWVPGAQQALAKLNRMRDVHVFILTARAEKDTRSIQFQLKRERFHNISVKCSPITHEMYSKRYVDYDLLVDDDREFVNDDNVVLAHPDGRHWPELFDRIKTMRNA